TKLAEGRSEIFTAGEGVASRDKRTARVWRDIRGRLEERMRAEGRAPGLEQITSALRVAHFVNRLLRDLLALAGHADSKERALPMAESVAYFRKRMEDPASVDLVARRMFAAKDGRADVGAMA